MGHLRTTDNNCGYCSLETKQSEDLTRIANRNLSELEKENPNLLILPFSFDRSEDKIGNEFLFSINSENKLTSNNLMGFIGINETQLAISSRFYPNNNDYFLHYMLQKVFSINLLDLKFETKEENIWDIFLLYLFPYYLKKAINQGMYKEYVRKNHNDANLKGAIDINRHIKENIPFKGTVAYRTREYTFDNRMTQLIRHAQEFIKSRGYSFVLNNDKETREGHNLININTPSYNKLNRKKVVQNNYRNLNHQYFTEYETLRKICLQILRRDGLSYGEREKNKVYGIVFDGAWLWEEFVNTYLGKKGFIHPTNKNGKNPIYLFEHNTYPRFPDFYNERIVLDAKYKHLNYVDKDDMHQIISYMYILKSQKGGFVYPIKISLHNQIINIGVLNGYAGNVYLYGVGVPSDCNNFNELRNAIDTNINNVISVLNETNHVSSTLETRL